MKAAANKVPNTSARPRKKANGGSQSAAGGNGRTNNKARNATLDAGSDTAAHIQNVALDLFARSSFSDVTIKDIGQATGLNTAMIYYYFRDKEDLFRSTVEIAVQRSLAAFEAEHLESNDPAAVIAGWIEFHIMQLDLIRKFVKVSLDYANSGKRVSRIDNAIGNFYKQENSILAAAIEKGIAERRFAERDIGRIVEFISTYLDGVMIRSYTFPDFDATGALSRFGTFVLEQLKRQPPKFDGD